MTGYAPQKAADINAAATPETTAQAEKKPTAKAVTAASADKGAGKAAGAFRTISEVADELNVQQHVLRFWETKFTQVKPLKRGGGRRYYRPEDVLLLKHIHNLLYTEGYTIKGVQKLLKGQGKAQIAAELAASEDQATSPVAAKAPANNAANNSVQAEAPAQAAASSAPVGMKKLPPLNDKQKSILEAMLGDLRDLRDLIRPADGSQSSE